MATTPKTMKAWQKHFPSKEPVLVEIPVPTIASDSLLIKIHAAGVCHSDVSILEMEGLPPFGWAYDAMTMGHEGCGEVVQVGSSVQGFQIGDMVAIICCPGCGEASCGECSRGLHHLCMTGERYGIGHHGSYAPYQAVKASAAAKLPAGVSVEQGAVATDACLTAYHAVVGQAQPKQHETIAIIGLGGLGFNALQIAQTFGCRIVVAEKRQAVLDEAVKFGVAPHDIVPSNETILDYVQRTGTVLDTIIDFVGVPETFTASQQAVRLGGKLVQVGMLAHEIPIMNGLALTKHISILCTFAGTMSDLKACLDLIASGKLRPQVEKGKLSELPQIIRALDEGKIKSRIALVPDV